MAVLSVRIKTCGKRNTIMFSLPTVYVHRWVQMTVWENLRVRKWYEK